MRNLLPLFIFSTLLLFSCKNKEKESCYKEKDLKSCEALCNKDDKAGCEIICMRKSNFGICKKACNLKSEVSCKRLRKLPDPRKKKVKQTKFNVNKLTFYLKECEKNKYSFCIRAGDEYANGQNGFKDIKKAAQYYKKGCEGGAAEGCTNYGDLLLHNAKVGIDKITGRKYLDIACKKGNFTGCHLLGVATLQGDGGSKNPKKAYKLFEKACKHDIQISCFLVGAKFALKKDKKSKTKAATLLRSACRAGVADSCLAIAHFYETGKGPVKKNIREAHAFYTLGCNAGNKASCSIVKAFHKKYHLNLQNEGAKSLEALCKKGDSKACFKAGDYYGRGISVPKDLKKAKTLLKKACDKGNKKGCDYLKSFNFNYIKHN